MTPLPTRMRIAIWAVSMVVFTFGMDRLHHLDRQVFTRRINESRTRMNYKTLVLMLVIAIIMLIIVMAGGNSWGAIGGGGGNW